MTADEYKGEIEKSLNFDKVLKLKGIKASLDMLSPAIVKSHVQMGLVESDGGMILFDFRQAFRKRG